MITFKEAAKQYYASREAQWKNAKHRVQFLSTLEQYAFAKIGRLSVADVDVGMVLTVLEPIWRDALGVAKRGTAKALLSGTANADFEANIEED